MVILIYKNIIYISVYEKNKMIETLIIINNNNYW